MNLIEHLNELGRQFLEFAWPMLWQSSLLIGLIFAADLLLTRRLRASVRHALWLVVLVKLLLPPTLALPTSAAWWLFPAQPVPHAAAPKPFVVTYDPADLAPLAPAVTETAMPMPPPTRLNRAGEVFLAASGVSVALLAWLLFRWGQVVRMVARADSGEAFAAQVDEVRRLVGMRRRLCVKWADDRTSPAVCGLFRPVILIPRLLAERLSAEQFRAVLLHEAMHLRRWDIWVNCAQAMLQVIYWWHPLVWLANARLRRVREEAVDDAVMLALAHESEIYAPTLLEVAKLAFRRPLMSLGLVGIMESRSALRQRIERLMVFRAPRKAGLTVLSGLSILAFGAVVLPMGQGPARAANEVLQSSSVTVPVATAPAPATDWHLGKTRLVPANNAVANADQRAPTVILQAEIYEMPVDSLKKLAAPLHFWPGAGGNEGWWTASPDQYARLLAEVKKTGLEPLMRPRIQTSTLAQFYVGDVTNGLELDCLLTVKGDEVALAVSGEIQAANRGLTNGFQANGTLTNRGGIIIQVPAGTSKTVVFINAEILPAPTVRSQGIGALAPVVGWVDASQAPISPAHQKTASKLNKIHLATVLFQGLPLDEVLRMLNEQTKAADPEKAGITFRVRSAEAFPAAPRINLSTGLPLGGEDISSVTITMEPQVLDASLRTVLDGVVLGATRPIHYSIADDGSVLFSPDDQTLRVTHIYSVDTNQFFTNLQNYASSGSSGTNGLGVVAALRAAFGKGGVDMDSGAVTVFYKDRLGMVYVKGPRSDLELVDRVMAKLNPVTNSLPTSAVTAGVRSNQAATVSASQRAEDGKVLYEMGQFDGAERALREAVRLDPNNGAANYYLNLIQKEKAQGNISSVSPAAASLAESNLVVTRTFLLMTSKPEAEVKRLLAEAGVTMPPTILSFNPNNNGILIARGTPEQLALVDRLILQWNGIANTNAEAASREFARSLRKEALHQRESDTGQLFSRTFRIDTNTFWEVLAKFNVQRLEDHAAPPTSTPSQMVRGYFSGLGVDWEYPPGKSIYFNDRRGYLFIRSTESDLDTIERAMQMLITQPPQVHLKARFIVVPKGTLDGLNGILGGPTPGGTNLTGILSNDNFQKALQALTSRPGVEILGEPEITVLSDRQTQIRQMDRITVTTNGLVAVKNGKKWFAPGLFEAETGPAMDAVSTVLADNYTVHLQAIPSLTEFRGYASLGQRGTLTEDVADIGKANADGPEREIVEPEFHTERLTANVNLWDNQTLLMTGLHTGTTNAEPKEVLVFITATIIDAAGRRVHTEEEMRSLPPVPVQPK